MAEPISLSETLSGMFSEFWKIMFNVDNQIFQGNWILFWLFHIYVFGIVFQLIRAFPQHTTSIATALVWPIKPMISMVKGLINLLYDISIVDKYNYNASEFETRTMVVRESLILNRYIVESFSPYYFGSEKKDFKRVYAGPDKDKAEAMFLLNKV